MDNSKNGKKIKILKDGPYIVTGNVALLEKVIVQKGSENELIDGEKLPQAERYSLCRCGKSKNPPFCDGSHVAAGFNGTETASRANYEDRADILKGPDLCLLDDNRCAYARFCHKEEGSVWELTQNSNSELYRREAIKAACDCPAGRLVAMDNAGNQIEPEYEPEINIVQDSEEAVSSGIFVKGYIPIESSDGQTYEVRNRVMLCRCGRSKNKPFCDATHVSIGFSDSEGKTK
jgi:CDGSH-type Zn-finger protein